MPTVDATTFDEDLERPTVMLPPGPLSRTARRVLEPYYSDPDTLRRAASTAADGTLEAFRRRMAGEIDEAGHQEESVEAIFVAVDDVPPDHPPGVVKKRLRLRIERLFGAE